MLTTLAFLVVSDSICSANVKPFAFLNDDPMSDIQHSDESTTVAELRDVLRQFVDEREWHVFHSPKNLSMAMAIEVAELMEHFQWLTIDESREVFRDAEKAGQIREEMADVFSYLLALANSLDVDLSDALFKKMVKNRLKYPADTCRGRADRPQA